MVNEKYLLIIDKVSGRDGLVDKILTEPESTEGQLYLKAKSLNSSNLKKSYVESALLASEDLEEISELLEVPVEVLDIYREVFYNVTGLDRLSRMELIDVPDKSESNLKLWALSQNLDFLRWRIGKPTVISPVDGLQELFTMCMYKSKESLFSGNTSDSSKESLRWVKMSSDIARLTKMWVLDSEAAKKDIELALLDSEIEFGGIAGLD